jgi:hypothetical protein
MGLPTNLPPTHTESVAMVLLSDLLAELEPAIDSLGGRVTKGVEEMYCFQAARYINKAVDGFVVLRDNHRLDSAKLLVRPALETTLRLKAVRAQPSLFYRILFTDALEDDQWLFALEQRQGLPHQSFRDNPDWIAFKARCEAQFGVGNITDRRLELREAAEVVGLGPYRESHYKTYCKFTHGAFRALAGDLDEVVDPQDSLTMVLCAISALQALADIGAHCPNIQSLNARVIELTNRKPDPLIRQQPS